MNERMMKMGFKRMIYNGYGKNLFLSLTKEWKGSYSYVGIFIISLFHFFIFPMGSFAQIRIGGNVYGGGNHAEVRGCTRVTVKAGDIGAVIEDVERPLADPAGRVFGGARMANVGGNSFVHIDGEHATDYILINQVFGGNDIAGTIGTTDTIPAALTAVKRVPADATDSKLGLTLSARALASKTRTRSKMPAFKTGMSNDAFWAAYKNERRVELAFEGHRFYDVRRWMEDGDKFMTVHAANITLDEEGNVVFGTPTTIVRGDGKWQNKWNLFPFSQTDILKSGGAIKQNPGW